MDIALLELTLRVALLATAINIPVAVLAGGWLPGEECEGAS